MTQHTRNFSFKVLTINTHKGFTAFNKRFILPELRDAVRTVGADIVCLQEVMGAHEVHPLHIENWPDTTHYEFLADTMWSDFAYGRNAVYPEGHHGNAVLSRYPIEYYENRDVSIGGSEKARRALLPYYTAHAATPYSRHVRSPWPAGKSSPGTVNSAGGMGKCLARIGTGTGGRGLQRLAAKGQSTIKRSRSGGDIYSRLWPTGAHVPGEYAIAATRSYLCQECPRQFPYGAAAARLATFIRPCPP
ncbi:Endonuclease/Exonuclease/ phosphatase family protein [Salmonella bongori]|nr:Endonuclease/Exonuclease/ phosphatase family protein [Salmonella bongori]